MAKQVQLIAEIERVLLAPYPASLRNLKTCLEQVDTQPVAAWAISKPCQVIPLLDVLVSRVDSDELASAALASVLRSPAVFEAFLDQHKPALERLYARQLQILCSRLSNESSSGASAESNTRTLDGQTLLKTPYVLPSNDGIPSSYYPYLECVIRGDDEESLGQWQERLYTFFADAPLELLASLSEPTIQLAFDRWKALFRSKDLAENLYAGYISSKLQRHAPAIFHNDSSPGSCVVICPALRAWIEKCYSNFQGQNGVQGVKGVLIRVLALTYHEAYRNVDNADIAISLSGEFLAVAQQYYAGDWASDNSEYTRKIAEKFCGAKSHLQLASVYVLAMLDPKDWLFDASNICMRILQILTAKESLEEPSPFPQVTTVDMLLQAANRCMALTSLEQTGHTFASFVKSLWNFIIEQCRPNQVATSCTLAGIQQALRTMQALQALDQHESSILVTLFMKAVEAIGVPEWWTLNLRSPGSPENCCSVQACVHFAEIQRQKLCDQVSVLLFSCGSAGQRQLPRSTIALLMQRLSQGCLGDEQPSCAYYPFLKLQQAPASTSHRELTSHNWRAYLGESLKASNGATYDLIENIVSMVCKDLEERCDIVEVPLQAAHNRVHELTEAIEQLESRISAMTLDKDRLEEALRLQQEARNHDSTLATDLEQTINSLRQQLAEAEQRMELMKADKVTADEYVKHQLEEMRQKALDDIETAQLQHATKVCELEAQLSSQVQTIHTLEHEGAWLKEQTDLARTELMDAHKQQLKQVQNSHEEEISQLQQVVAQLQEKASADSEELIRLAGDVRQRDQSIEGLTRLCSDHEVTCSTLQSELAAANASKAALSTELAEAQAENKNVSEQLAAQGDQVQKQAQRVTELESMATRSQQRCAKLEKALAEARQREEGISALLGGRVSAAPAPAPARRATLTAPTMRNSTQGFDNSAQAGFNAQQTSAPRLPENSFISDDDDDYYEIMKLPH